MFKNNAEKMVAYGYTTIAFAIGSKMNAYELSDNLSICHVIMLPIVTVKKNL